MTNTPYEPINEVERRLGLSWINLAHRGVKSHLGKKLDYNVALVLFDKPREQTSMLTLWNIEAAQAITSTPLTFPTGMLWDWDWRAKELESAIEAMTLARSGPAVPGM